MRGGRAARGFSGGLIRRGWTAEGASAGRLSALTRRYVSANDGFVNCGPSGCRVWPVLAPAGGIVRAGAVLRAVFRADAAGSVAGMDVFSPKSRKVRQPGLPVGESADHRRSRRRTKGRGERSRRRGRVRFCASISTLRCFPRGVRWGKRWKPHCGRAPDCAKAPLALWTLFIWVVMWGRFTRRRALGRNEDLTGLRSFCACHAFLSCVPVEMSCVRSRLLFAACAPNRTACDMFRSCSAVGRDRHSCVLGCRVVIELGWFTSGLRVSLWRSRRRTKGRGERSRRRGGRALLRKHIGFAAFSAGSPLGAARPQTCAKETRLPGLSSFGS